MELDPAVVALLKLDPERTTISAAGGGGCSMASTFQITTTTVDGTRKSFFMKAAQGDDAATMFEGEHASLSAIHDAVPDLCPRSYGHGSFASSQHTHFLVTDFIALTSRRGDSSTRRSTRTLAAKLAELHNTPAPTPAGFAKPQFGFPVTTCCGDTPQENSFRSSWADFFANNRLRSIISRAEKRNGKDAELKQKVEDVAGKVVPRLLGDDRLNGGGGVTPIVVHGDLWSGNAGTGEIGGRRVGEVVYDPSACYAHSEYELGIMKMFGGFGREFLDEYHALCPKTQPVDEYEDRVALYELYHHLNHYAMFGGGYKSGAVRIMERLLRKYAT